MNDIPLQAYREGTQQRLTYLEDTAQQVPVGSSLSFGNESSI